jgi:hypothetical protein
MLGVLPMIHVAHLIGRTHIRLLMPAEGGDIQAIKAMTQHVVVKAATRGATRLIGCHVIVRLVLLPTRRAQQGTGAEVVRGLERLLGRL